MARLTYAYYAKRKELADFGFMMFDNKNPQTDYAVQLGYNAELNSLVKAGVRGIYTKPGSNNALVIGVGAQGKFDFTRNIGISGHAYYAPSVVSFLDATQYKEFSLRFNYFVTSSLDAYVAYRKFKVRLVDNQTVDLDSDFHVGMKMSF